MRAPAALRFPPRAACALLWLAVAPVAFATERSLTPTAMATHAVASAQALAARLEPMQDGARLSFDLDRAVPVTAFVLVDPDRAIIDLPEVEFRIDPAVGRAAAQPNPRGRAKRSAVLKPVALLGPVAAFRFGLFAAGKSRVVIDLAAPARISRAICEPREGGGARLVIDLVKTDRAAFAQSAQPVPEPVKARVALVEGPESDQRPVIVVDAGHGGIDTGARSPTGVFEKDVVLEFAHALAAKLDQTHAFRVMMTRPDDVFVPLDERVAIARRAHAALFVSIHADALSEQAGVTGATVYTVSDKASDAEAARVADKENQADATAGVQASEDQSDVSDILFDLTRRETRAYSHVFARTLVGYWRNTARLNKNPERAAGFRVLKAPDVPSVLLELGYLSSDKDLPSLTSPDWREAASGAVAAAINRFFAARGAPESPSQKSAAGETLFVPTP